jgi:hypothetical protein
MIGGNRPPARELGLMYLLGQSLSRRDLRTEPAVAMKWPDRTAQARHLPGLGKPLQRAR